MAAAKNMHGHWFDFCFLRELSSNMPDGDNRHPNLLQHGSTVNKPGYASEMKQICSLGYPALHPPFCPHRDPGRAVPRCLMVRQAVANEITLLCLHGAGRFLIELAPLRITRSRLCEQESVIRCDKDIIAVQVVDNICEEF